MALSIVLVAFFIILSSSISSFWVALIYRYIHNIQNERNPLFKGFFNVILDHDNNLQQKKREFFLAKIMYFI